MGIDSPKISGRQPTTLPRGDATPSAVPFTKAVSAQIADTGDRSEARPASAAPTVIPAPAARGIPQLKVASSSVAEQFATLLNDEVASIKQRIDAVPGAALMFIEAVEKRLGPLPAKMNSPEGKTWWRRAELAASMLVGFANEPHWTTLMGGLSELELELEERGGNPHPEFLEYLAGRSAEFRRRADRLGRTLEALDLSKSLRQLIDRNFPKLKDRVANADLDAMAKAFHDSATALADAMCTKFDTLSDTADNLRDREIALNCATRWSALGQEFFEDEGRSLAVSSLLELDKAVS